MAAWCISLGPVPISEALLWLDDAQARSAAYEPQIEILKAGLLAQSGHFEEARSLLAKTIAQIKERGLKLLTAMAMGAAREIEMLADHSSAAERVAREGCELLMQLGERSWLSTQACHLADVLYTLGRYEESAQWALRGLELGSTDDVVTQIYGLNVQSRLLARNGDAPAALSLAEKADGLARSSDSPRAQGDSALSLAHVMHLTGDPSRAEKAVRRAISCYRRKGATAYIARAQRIAAAWTSARSSVSG